MIIDKNVTIILTNENFHLTKRVEIGEYEIGDEITIPIENLEFSDRVKINVKCDICGGIKKIMYRNYNLNLKSNNEKYCCCLKSQKIKKTCLEKYGVENVSYINDVVEKRKKTSIKNWGVDNHMKNKDFLDNLKKQNLEKYGYSTPFESKKILKKCSETVQRKYNVKNVFQNEDIKSKIRKTNLEKYGAEHPLGSKELKTKFIKTLIEKYGVENPSKSDIIKNKVKKTKIEKGYTFDDSDWNIFKNKVRIFTGNHLQKLFNNWDGYDYYDNEYIKDNFKFHYNDKNYPTVDHKISIINGYKLSIPPEIIGGIDNLCYTKRYLNSKKNYKNEKDFQII